jgi:hypothetical protein
MISGSGVSRFVVDAGRSARGGDGFDATIVRSDSADDEPAYSEAA